MSDTKLERLAELGVEHPIKLTDPDCLEDALAERAPVDSVLNHLGGEFTEPCLSVLRTDGRMVICGRTAGRYSTVDTQDLFLGHKQILGSTMGTHSDLERIVEFVEDGAFEPPVHATYGLDETDQAFADMESRDAFGKLVVIP